VTMTQTVCWVWFTRAMDRWPAGAACLGGDALADGVGLAVVAFGVGVRLGVGVADGTALEADGAEGVAAAAAGCPAARVVPTPFGGAGQKTMTSTATTAAVPANHHPRAERFRCFLRAMACLSPPPV